MMNFRELNSHVTAFTANVDVCADREWRRLGTNLAIDNLRTANLHNYTNTRTCVVLPECDLSWSKLLPREVGVWIQCGVHCEEVCAYRDVNVGRNCGPRHFILPR